MGGVTEGWHKTSKRAFLVGINGFAPRDVRSDVPELRGCVNDVERMALHLTEDFGFPKTEILVLRNEEATGTAVRRGLRWLLRDYDGDGTDVRVFHISTHGTQVKVESEGDEASGDNLDEAFVVYDHKWRRPFRDNEIREFFAEVPENVSVVFQADCCHSGDISDPGIATAEIGSRPSRGRAPWPKDLADKESSRSRKLPNPDVSASRDEAKSKDFRIVGSVSRPILISACEDVQESKEFRTRDGFHGGLTWAVSKTIEEAKRKNRGDATKLTYNRLINEVGNHLRFSEQTPLLQCQEGLLDTPLFSPVGGEDRGTNAATGRGGRSNMNDKTVTTPDQLILFLMNYVSNPKKYKSQKKRVELMRHCGIHPKVVEAMKTKSFENIAQALSDFTKPIGDEGGRKPIGDEGGRT